MCKVEGSRFDPRCDEIFSAFEIVVFILKFKDAIAWNSI